jgi:hypothetical protein
MGYVASVTRNLIRFQQFAFSKLNPNSLTFTSMARAPITTPSKSNTSARCHTDFRCAVRSNGLGPRSRVVD